MRQYNLLNLYRLHHERQIDEGMPRDLAITSAFIKFTMDMVELMGPPDEWENDDKIFMTKMLGEVEKGRHPFFTLGKQYKKDDEL